MYVVTHALQVQYESRNIERQEGHVASFLRAYFGPISRKRTALISWSLVVQSQSLFMVVEGLFSFQIQTQNFTL